MRSRVIPAQITTVEDKIVGNLNLLQLILLIMPVLWLTLIYALFPPTMKFVAYKLTLTLAMGLISVGLAVRLKGKIVVDWLRILIKYNARPKYYLYNKNDLAHRALTELQLQPKPGKSVAQAKKPTPVETKPASIKLPNLLALEELIKSTCVTKPIRKGA